MEIESVKDGFDVDILETEPLTQRIDKIVDHLEDVNDTITDATSVVETLELDLLTLKVLTMFILLQQSSSSFDLTSNFYNCYTDIFLTVGILSKAVNTV